MNHRCSVAARALALALAWLAIAVPAGLLFFSHASKIIVLASHDAVVRPNLDGYATLDLGAYLPSFRYPTGNAIGADIDLGKTTADSYPALIERYAALASQPAGQVAKLRTTLTDIAQKAALEGALAGLIAPGLWLLVGSGRRRELVRKVTPRRVMVAGTVGAVVAVSVVGVTRPWMSETPEVEPDPVWAPIALALPDVPVPDAAQLVEVETGLMTSGTEQLVASAFDSYRRSLTFYNDVVERTEELAGQLHQPADDELVALLVSDRHDNVGMDPVARAIADQGGATVLFDAGDDTSTGGSWEAFSLDSLDEAFDDFDERYAIAGNHDNGDFVTDYTKKLGFTTLDGDVIDGPDGIRLLGASDPRSSGLGTWRNEGNISFGEQTQRLADVACEHDEDGERVSTLLVHDANTGDEALRRGCVDLVLAGHLHTQVGPTRVLGENDKSGYEFTNGTTGGAAYALAIGSKLRRDAQVTLVTYREGRPVGVQPVTIRTIGDFRVGDYTELDLSSQTSIDNADETVPGDE